MPLSGFSRFAVGFNQIMGMSGHVGVQLLRSGLGQLVLVVIPSSAFEEKTPDETAIAGTSGEFCFGFLYHLSKTMGPTLRHDEVMCS